MNHKKKQYRDIRMMCLTGLFMALICVATLFFKIQIPLGYAHLGNGFIFLAAVLLGNPYGMLAAGIGSALSDLMGGYAEWIIPTLIIKCIMGALVAGIAGESKVTSPRTLLAVIVGGIEMVAGYTLAGTFLYGSVAAGLSQIPGLVGETLVGIALFYFLSAVFEKSHVKKYLISKES